MNKAYYPDYLAGSFESLRIIQEFAEYGYSVEFVSSKEYRMATGTDKIFNSALDYLEAVEHMEI